MEKAVQQGYLGGNQRKALQESIFSYIMFPLHQYLNSETKQNKTDTECGRQERLGSVSKIQVNTFSITNPEKSSKEWNLCNDNHTTLNLIKRISRDFIFCSPLIQYMHAKNKLKCFLLPKLISSSDSTTDSGYFLLLTKYYFTQNCTESLNSKSKDLKLISQSGLTAINEARSHEKRSLNSSAVCSPTSHLHMQHPEALTYY